MLLLISLLTRSSQRAQKLRYDLGAVRVYLSLFCFLQGFWGFAEDSLEKNPVAQITRALISKGKAFTAQTAPLDFESLPS